MIKRSIEPLLQLAHAADYSGIDEGVEVAEAGNFFAQRIEPAQQLHVLFRQGGNIGVGENLDQCNFEGR
jgi:hypothetical protein